MARESLIGSLTCTRSSAQLAETMTVPRRVPASRPSRASTLVARKLGQFTVPYKPRGVVCTPQGNVVVCGNWTCNASVYQPDGRELAQLKLPYNSLTTDMACTANRILVADAKTKLILEFKSDGSYVRSVNVGFGGAMGICVLDKKVYITSSSEGKVYTVDWSGRHKQVSVEGTANAEIKYPLFVAADHSSIAVSCHDNNTVHVFNKAGRLNFTYKGQSSTSAELSGPCGVVIDADGRVLISSMNNDLIHIVSSEGQFLGQIDINQDGLTLPVGLALNPQGQLVVAACSYNTIATYEYTF